MGLTDNFLEWDYKKVNVISKNSFYHNKIFESIKLFEDVGLPIPKHTVIIYPDFYPTDTESPATYPTSRIIMLFPLNQAEGLMFQYLHELGHLLIGLSPKRDRWVDEVIACSCNFFLYPKNTECYKKYISTRILTLEQNRTNLIQLGDKINGMPKLVYTANNKIESFLYAYYLKNKDFHFITLLSDLVASSNDPNKRNEIIETLKATILLRNTSTIIC